MNKPLKIFRNLYDVLEDLPDNNWCFYWDSVLKYFFEGKEPVIDNDPQAIALWNAIKTLVDIANSDRRSVTSAENGKKHKKRNTDLEYEEDHE